MTRTVHELERDLRQSGTSVPRTRPARRDPPPRRSPPSGPAYRAGRWRPGGRRRGWCRARDRWLRRRRAGPPADRPTERCAARALGPGEAGPAGDPRRYQGVDRGRSSSPDLTCRPTWRWRSPRTTSSEPRSTPAPASTSARRSSPRGPSRTGSTTASRASSGPTSRREDGGHPGGLARTRHPRRLRRGHARLRLCRTGTAPMRTARARRPSWPTSRTSGTCSWGMGTDRFLQTGSRRWRSSRLPTSAPVVRPSLAIAGLDGTERRPRRLHLQRRHGHRGHGARRNPRRGRHHAVRERAGRSGLRHRVRRRRRGRREPPAPRLRQPRRLRGALNHADWGPPRLST